MAKSSSATSFKPVVIAPLILLLLTIVAVVTWFKSGRSHPVPEVSSTDEPPTLPLPQSDFLNTAAEVAYVGSQRCSECHTDQHATYLQTAHSRSLVEVDPEQEPPDATFDHALSSRRYVSYRRGGKLYHRESVLLADGSELPTAEYPLRYLVGSGRFSRTYVASSGEFLVESPLTWYASLNAWAMSPGYDAPNHEAFHRPVGFDCLYCHAGNLEAAPGSAELVTLHELAIGCERCHGPGELHIKKHTASSTTLSATVDFTIVNPARLSRDLVEAVCQQCHLESVVRVAARGRARGQFRPGLPWNAFYVNYGFKEQQEAMTVTGHVEQLRLSRCYNESTTLTCVTCHNPHASQPSTRPLYRDTCLQCHRINSCGTPEADRAAAEDDCVACHMPRSGTDIPHIAFTHHRIGVHQPMTAEPSQPVSDHDLVPVLADSIYTASEAERMLGLAYVEMFRSEHDAFERTRYYDRATGLLSDASAAEAGDAILAAAQAELAYARGDSELAEKHARQAMAQQAIFAEGHLLPTEVLAQVHLRAGRVEEAIAALSTLTSLRLYPADWFLLGICQQRLGRTGEALSCFERVIALDGSQPEAYEMLAVLHRELGDSGQADEFADKARQLRQRQAQLGLRQSRP